MSYSDEEVVNEIVRMINEAYNPRETREAINEKFPEYNDKEKLKSLVPKILSKFDKKKQQHMKKTEYLMYFLIAGKDIVKKRVISNK
ncbi:MAG: hypothetical protein ACTSQO_15105 [Candidatus Helarchaeota archaeon]